MDKLQKAKNALTKKYELESELSDMEQFHLENITQLNQDKTDKKEKRQTALAYGENVSKITNALIRIDSKIEESEDALIGIRQRQAGLKPEIVSIEREIAYMELEAEQVRLWKIARKYNEKAKELAEIVKDFWDLYDHLESDKFVGNSRIYIRSGVTCDDFHSGALNKIPFLRINGENPRTSAFRIEYLFDLYYYRNYERRQRYQAAIAQQAPVVQENSVPVYEADEDDFENGEYVEGEEYSEEENYGEDGDYDDSADFEDDEYAEEYDELSDAEESEET